MENKTTVKKVNKSAIKNLHTTAIASRQTEALMQESRHAEFLNAFSSLYSTVLIRKLRKLKTELKTQYVITIESFQITKNPDILEMPIIIRSKADNKLGKISII